MIESDSVLDYILVFQYAPFNTITMRYRMIVSVAAIFFLLWCRWNSLLFYLMFMFIVNILLLNVLIARMSDTYSKFRDDAHIALCLARAWIISKVEHTSFLHADVSQRQGDQGIAHDKWQYWSEIDLLVIVCTRFTLPGHEILHSQQNLLEDPRCVRTAHSGQSLICFGLWEKNPKGAVGASLLLKFMPSRTNPMCICSTSVQMILVAWLMWGLWLNSSLSPDRIPVFKHWPPFFFFYI